MLRHDLDLEMCGDVTDGLCQRVEHIDRPADIEGLPQPARHRGPRVETEALSFVSCSHALHRIAGHARRRRDIRQGPAIRTTELKLAVRPPIDLITLLMDGAMMPAAQQGEVRERGRASLGPMTDVVALADAHCAAREAAAPVTVEQRPPDRRGNGPGTSCDFDDAPVPRVPHHHAAGVAGQLPGRFL